MIDVHFKLTDAEYAPLAGVPVRVALGSGWRDPDAGKRFVTDSSGESVFAAATDVDRRWRRLPTNFVDSLFSVPKRTEHLAVATQLEFMDRPCLYVLDIHRFPHGGDVLLDRFSCYTADPGGRFTRQVRQDRNGDWHMRELGGLLLTSVGHKPSNYLLEPAPGGWSLQLAFMRFPPPIRR